MKCIKAIVNTKVGGKEAMDHPEYIHTVVFSIHCPHWQTRKMVCELLAFLCYLDGYEHVVRGFEQLKKFKNSLVLFDTWMREFLGTLMGGQKLPESHLMDYALSNMILVNALTKIPPDVNQRIYMRNQFHAAGLQPTILPKLEELDFNLLNIQIRSFKEAAENDMEDAFGNDIIMDYAVPPTELVNRAMDNIADSERGKEYLVSILKHFLWIKGDPETKAQYYHMINIIVQQIVMDRRPHAKSEDFSSTFGMAVSAVFQNFHDLDRLRSIDRDFKDLRDRYDTLSTEKNCLEAEVQKLRILPTQLEIESQNQRNLYLKKENDSLRDVLKTSKDTIAMLQERLAAAESQLKERRKSEILVLNDDWRVAQRRTGLSMDELRLPSKAQPWTSSDIEKANCTNSLGFGGFHFPFFGKKSRKKRHMRSDSSSSSTCKSLVSIF